MTEINELYFSLGYCAFMLIIAWIVKRYPPKNINYSYGYRTNRSMKNQDIWNEANRFSSNLMYRLCLYCFIVPAAGYFLFPENNFLVTVIVNTLLVVSILYFTERHLNRLFDKEGNRIESTLHTKS